MPGLFDYIMLFGGIGAIGLFIWGAIMIIHGKPKRRKVKAR